MENRTFYNEILTDHNLHPLHKEKLPDANLVLEGVNPSCGDDIILQLKVEDGQVVDGAFEGSGCAISQASADIMLDLIIGKSEEEARHLADLFLRMIKGEAGENEIEELEEAGALVDVSHMPARVKCAVLGWHTLTQNQTSQTASATCQYSGIDFSADGGGSTASALVGLGHRLEQLQSAAPVMPVQHHTDRKVLQKEREKKIALGHKADDREDEVSYDWQQTM